MTVTAADVHIRVRTFYARQMRLLGDLAIDDYAATFTDDGVVEHTHRGERAEGRAALLAGMRAALPRYAGVTVRHWFDHLLIEPLGDGAWQVSYLALVTRTDRQGAVTFEPTFSVEDVLVERDGELYTRARIISRDGQGS